MSSVSSTNSTTSTSSIYGSRNVISGLASGLDTETMIENAVSGYQTKITNLEAKRTKYEWKQEAYRDIISSMVNFNQKYTSYTSSTNLLSSSFFNSATQVTTSGDNKTKAAATGRSTSEVQLAAVKQLATATRFSVDAATANPDLVSEVASKSFNLTDQMELGTLQGSLTLGYGGKTISISFDESDLVTDAQSMADLINQKLEDETVSFSSGSKSASELIHADVGADGKVTLTSTGTGGNSVWIDATSGNLASKLGITSTGNSVKSFSVSNGGYVDREKTKQQYLSENGFSITVDGKTKTIKGPTDEEIQAAKTKINKDDPDSVSDTEAYIKALNEKIGEEFSGLTVSNADGTGSGAIQLQFNVDNDTSTYKVTSAAGDAIGIDGSLSNYVDTSKTLSGLLGDTGLSDDGSKYVLEFGSTKLEFSKDTSLKDVMSEINSNDDVGFKVNYSQITKQFTFTAKETGESGKIEIAQNSAAAKIFGVSTVSNSTGGYSVKNDDGSELKDSNGNDVAKVTQGQNAVFTVIVDGTAKDMDRESNTVDVDGLSVTLKGEFNTGLYDGDDTTSLDDKVKALDSDSIISFNVTSDTDTIISAIRDMVNDYNTMASAIKSAYSTMPLEKSDGSSYEPLSDDDKADMSDSAIERYETNAKTGLLFGDSDLSSCYSALLNAINSSTASSKVFAEIGISTSYSDGTTTLTLNETKLKEALESDPDKVRDAFTGSNGLMQGLSDAVDRYAGTTGATKGILIEKAGSTLAPTSIYSNTWQSAIDDLDDEIEKWQDKLSDKIDYYTTQFTNLETLISEMNSQSSMLSSLSGGY
jgi:flagellar hook-associated protein 2